MGVAVDAGLAAVLGEGLELRDHLTREVALTGCPQLALVEMVELGKDKSMCAKPHRLQHAVEPGELIRIIGAVGVEAGKRTLP